MSLNNANLESYKKALHSIVKRLNKTPSASSKSSLRRSDSKLNQTQQPIYNQNSSLLNISNSSKKYNVNNNYVSKNQPSSKRSLSNDRTYKNNKDLLNKSMHEPYIRKGSFSANIGKSISINKLEKPENQGLDDGMDKGLMNVDHAYAQSPGLNSTILQDVDFNNLDADGDKKLRDLVHKYQLRDAIHRQEITKLKKSNELLRTHIYELEKETDKNKKDKETEKRYISRLEAELSQLKEKMRVEANEKRPTTPTLLDNKETHYLKIIEDLKAHVKNLSSEKKLVEHLLKNALTQHDMAKENNKNTSGSSGAHKVLENSNLAINSCKYANMGAKMKTDTYTKKSNVSTTYNDENDYSSYTQAPTANSSFAGNSFKLSKDNEGSKEGKQVNSSVTVDKMEKFLQQDSTYSSVQLTEDGDEPFPNKVFHPQPNEKSLKERIDMNQFKLDLSIISKNRKVG